MTHKDHVELVRDGVLTSGGVWADLGSGTGAFTLALRDVAGADVTIYSIDKDETALEYQKKAFDQQFPGTNITFITADFTKPLYLPPLNGIIMANSLHFVQDKAPLLKRVRDYLKEDGRFIVVEYNTDTGNWWVPYPLSFQTFQELAVQSGFTKPQLLKTVPSHFLKEIYAAITLRNSARRRCRHAKSSTPQF